MKLDVPTSEFTPRLCTCHFPDGEPAKYPIITKSDLELMLEKERELRKKERIQHENVLNKLNEGLQKIFTDDQLALIYNSETGVKVWSHQAMFKALKLFKLLSCKKYMQVIELLKIPFPSLRAVRKLTKKWEVGNRIVGETETENAVHGLNGMETSAIGDEDGSLTSDAAQNGTPRKITTTTISIAGDTDDDEATNSNEEDVEDKRERKNRPEPERTRAKRNPNRPAWRSLEKGRKLWPPKGVKIKIKTTPMAEIDPVEMEMAMKEAREMADKRTEEIRAPRSLPLPPSKMMKFKWFKEKHADMAERIEHLWRGKEAANARRRQRSKKSASKTSDQAGTSSQFLPDTFALGTLDQLATHGAVLDSDEDMIEVPKSPPRQRKQTRKKEPSSKSAKSSPRTRSSKPAIAPPTRVTRATRTSGDIDFSFLFQSMGDDD